MRVCLIGRLVNRELLGQLRTVWAIRLKGAAASSRSARRLAGRAPRAGSRRPGCSRTQRPSGGGPGLEVSLFQLSQHVDVERLVGHDLLQADVLALQVLQALRVVGQHGAVLVARAVPGRLGDHEVATDVLDRPSLTEQLVTLRELADMRSSFPHLGGSDSLSGWISSAGPDQCLRTS